MVEAGGHSTASPQEASLSSLFSCSGGSELEEPFANTQGGPGRVTLKVKSEDSKKKQRVNPITTKKQTCKEKTASLLFFLHSVVNVSFTGLHLLSCNG